MNRANNKHLSNTRAKVDAFLAKVRATPPAHNRRTGGRLIFALDATASREPTWDHASQLQAQMFTETADLGGLQVQLCHYRGFGEFHTSPWLSDPQQLLRRMTAVRCLGGHTQIEKVLRHAARESKQTGKVNALIFVGDCVEEDVDSLARAAGELALLGTPAFLFQEGHDPAARRAFAHIAQLTGGAHCTFDTGSAQQLRDLLKAVAVYATGGRPALDNFHQRHGNVVLKLTRQK
jgi:hypothetical protein